MRAAIVVTGREILTGRRTDALVAPIAGRISAVGLTMHETVMVADDPLHLKKTLVRLMTEAGFILVTGGLGLTPDDTTRRAVALLEAERPPVAERKVANPVGSAFGIDLDYGDCRIVFVPGVPEEALAMVPEVLAGLGSAAEKAVELMIFGLRETAIAERLGDLADSCAFLPRDKEVALVVPSAVEPQVRLLLGRHVVDRRGVAWDTGLLLRERGLTCAAAESCTGGLVGHLITQVPGSSEYFLGSVVSYSNEVKTSVLGVGRALLEEHGAVSEAVARAMLQGVLRLTGAVVGVAVTGIAGPDGKTPDKPVGTVWICAGSRAHTVARRFSFTFDRAGNKMVSAKTALFMLRELIHDQDIRGHRPAD
ncbi:MAG TPA: nicotinamide-nucleotide amidohydrolase family protein [Deltaproteobacteria bacterium]|nr:nicotinamide-nucleotide amidohydrolase family protein [Deltaproteobacteria bacterium]